MTRHEIRKKVFQAVFLRSFYSEAEIDDRIQCFLEAEAPSEEDEEEALSEAVKDEISDTASRVMERLPKIDALLNEVTEGWKTDRMAKVDLAVLRLAVYEIKYTDVPDKVAINEAVELAKAFGTDKSGGFVNGVLARVVAG